MKLDFGIRQVAKLLKPNTARLRERTVGSDGSITVTVIGKITAR